MGCPYQYFRMGAGGWRAARPECPVKLKYPVHALRLIRTIARPCRILVWDRRRFLGYFRPLPHHVGRGQAGNPARPGGGGGFGGGSGTGAGRPGAQRMGAAAAARGGGRGGRPGGVAAACGGGTLGRARALHGAAGGWRKRRIRTQSVGTAAGGVGGNGRADMGPRAGQAAHATAAGLSRGVGKRGREPRVDALHRDAGARVHGSAPGTRRARGGDRDQPVRRALPSQLGLRRFRRSQASDRLGGGGTRGQFRGPESAARHPQPAAVQHQPLPPEQHFLSELPLSGCRGYGGLPAVPACPGIARNAGSDARDRGVARHAVCGI